MSIIPLVIIANEIIVFEFATVFRLNLPVEECTKGITLHKAIKQTANLISPPYKLTLDSW